jgi:hypothetical protein
MRKWLVLMVMVAFGLMFLGAGCAKPNSIEATDTLTGSSTAINVEWAWQGSGDNVITPKYYKLFRSDNPFTGFSQIGGTLTKSPYNDTTAGASKIWFYKVQAFDKTDVGSDLSWAEGGCTPGALYDDAQVNAAVAAWERGGNCIHWWTEKQYGATPIPPIDADWPGTTGNLWLHMYFDNSAIDSGIGAVADFTFEQVAGHGYSAPCTNNQAEMVGLQHGVVSVGTYDGFLRGSVLYGTGWINYHLVVTGKHSSDGYFYAYDAAHAKTAYVYYAAAPWGNCSGAGARCDTPATCCP